jgi:hypothetical protein
MPKPNHKAVTLEGTDEVPMAEDQEYFFPDIEGKQVTVKAKSRKEAEKKAKEKANELTQ